MRMRIRFTLPLILLAAVWAVAQTLPAKRSDNYDANARDGRFDLRVRVDGATDFYIRGAEIRYRLRNGRPPTDEGSEYRSELPRGPLEGLNLEQRDGRNQIRIAEEPSQRNNWTLVLSIDDTQGGDSRYHARITWTGSVPGGRPGGIGIGGAGRDRVAFDRGSQLGSEDARRRVTRDYRRHSQEFNARSERSFQQGYEEGYDANRGGNLGSGRVFDRGVELGAEDARRGMSRDYRRYTTEYDLRSERRFQQGYEQGFDAGRGGNIGSGRVFDRGVELGTEDARRGLARNHRRYNTEFDLRSERSFQQGYEQGYDANRGSGGDRTFFDRGYRLGSDDARRSLARDYRRYRTEFDSRTERSFQEGYEQGYDATVGSGRSIGGAAIGGAGTEAQRAYADGRTYGQTDARDRVRPDYSRHSARYNTRTESEFRRGYEAGYYNRP